MSFMAQPIRDKKSGIFYTRVSVPLDIKDAFCRSEVKHSLRTRDPKKAAKLHAIQYAEFMAEFDAFRRRQQTLNTKTSKHKHAYDELTRFDVAILAARFYKAEYEKIVRNTSYTVLGKLTNNLFKSNGFNKAGVRKS
ncbi:hypothetical protein JYB87_09320 [Shewanella avicenniae]|uniref:DUF6538 domain-containing protein n=1 Tax=Shewanella avicenniae TaxID=2814294 RepID=A0ABX7QKM6_9GAMM|nr:DUF6538 domain-containing protein [Shewanella avicenniae]QSX31994.1 hypothetical protein JYB87_09320 [Shewanella avicenniae]